MSEIFREIDEEVRREQMLKLWRTYGRYLVAAAVAVALGVAGGIGVKKYLLSQRMAEGAQFAAAVELLDIGQPALAAQRFALLADDAGAGYAALARLREAEALAASGDADGALAALDRLAADEGAEPAIRGLASLLAVLRMVDTAPPNELEARLGPLLEEGSPWRASARELDGLIALRRGETGRAREIFGALAGDASTPPAARSRAAELLAITDGGALGGG